jgi:ATP-binding cassette subfamily B protein
MHADSILVMDEGELVGQGTHKELFESCEVYREIVLSQLAKEEMA